MAVRQQSKGGKAAHRRGHCRGKRIDTAVGHRDSGTIDRLVDHHFALQRAAGYFGRVVAQRDRYRLGQRARRTELIRRAINQSWTCRRLTAGGDGDRGVGVHRLDFAANNCMTDWTATLIRY